MTTTALIYGYSNIVDEAPIANGFWRMRLDTGGQVQPIATFSRRDRAFSGHLSADAQWIAYLSGIDKPLTLHVMDVNGENDRVLSTTIGSHDPGCTPGYVWSYTGTQLAFREPNPLGTLGTQLSVYDPTHDTAPTQVVSYTTSSKFIGWQDNDHLLILVLAEYKQPLHLEQVAVATGERQVLTTLPRYERVYCARQSPDGRYILFGMETVTYLFDVAARTFTPIDVAARGAIWAHDAQALLEFAGDYSQIIRFVPLNAEHTEVDERFAPPDGADRLFGILSASPDGRYIVGCDTPDEGRTDRSLLYDTQQQQWETLAEGT
ncbi:MAG: hypothetical protein HC911_11690, partial [Chloroflexaceae bacterium]|nr:hypothetical protein [Chloroflexaceae bacterium]